MRHGAIHRPERETCLVANVSKTANAWERMRGLLGRPPLTPGQGLLIEPCPSVHTLGMRYPIDIVFLDANYHVLRLVPRLKPLRWAVCSGAQATLELAPGALDDMDIAVGEKIEWRAA